MVTTGPATPKIQVRDSLDEINELFLARGWSDGLPIIPPTEERLTAMLAGTKRSRLESLGQVPPLWGEATVEKVAINAVMAGCKPEYLPALIAVVEALLEPAATAPGRGPGMWLFGTQATTNPGEPGILFNGPIRKQLGINCGQNLFGEGYRANATIGRALRLILRNIGGARPEMGTSMKTHGGSTRYTWCFGENEEESPWEPLHVERGFQKSQSTVTPFTGLGPVNLNDHVGTTAEHILVLAVEGVTNVAPAQTGGLLLVLSPEHARTIADDGWTKEDIRRFIATKAQMPLKKFKMNGLLFGDPAGDSPRWRVSGPDEYPVPCMTGPQDVHVVVAGGAGKHSAIIIGQLRPSKVVNP